jgi:hypothetical protein
MLGFAVLTRNLQFPDYAALHPGYIFNEHCSQILLVLPVVIFFYYKNPCASVSLWLVLD